MLSEPEIVAYKVAAAFDAVGIEYTLGGSMASIIHGIPRLTADVDFVAQIAPEQIAPLAAELSGEFYVDADMIVSALRQGEEEGSVGSSFNVIHLATMVKADVFVQQISPFHQSKWQRRQLRRIAPDAEMRPIFVASAEDMILQKLTWYRMTGERSDNQWGDVLGMLKVQGDGLDKTYLQYWAAELGLSNLLVTAAQDAGLNMNQVE